MDKKAKIILTTTLSAIMVFYIVYAIVGMVNDKKAVQNKEDHYSMNEVKAAMDTCHFKLLRAKFDPIVADNICSCIYDSLTKKFTRKELDSLYTLPIQKQQQAVLEISNYCSKKYVK